jgi:hypothetical protein
MVRCGTGSIFERWALRIWRPLMRFCAALCVGSPWRFFHRAKPIGDMPFIIIALSDIPTHLDQVYGLQRTIKSRLVDFGCSALHCVTSESVLGGMSERVRDTSLTRVIARPRKGLGRPDAVRRLFSVARPAGNRVTGGFLERRTRAAIMSVCSFADIAPPSSHFRTDSATSSRRDSA